MVTADTLSRAPLQTLSVTDSQLQDDCDAYVAMTIDSLPTTELKLQQIRDVLKKDDVCQQLMQFSINGWPHRVSGQLKIPVLSEQTVQNELLLRGNQLVIPSSMQPDILQHLHMGHQGITKCRENARHSVWWVAWTW